jgi:hypothetical protein
VVAVVAVWQIIVRESSISDAVCGLASLKRRKLNYPWIDLPLSLCQVPPLIHRMAFCGQVLGCAN